ncbi:MAG: nicotinate (nicotinamide) nucleotide adenylyltransferase [Bacteroidota bacterium]
MKIGLFFGSFNPIHSGHLIIANYMVSHSDLDEIWFVVSPHNPLKQKKTLLADNHRLEMVRISIENSQKLKVSDIEFKMPQPSYTIDTLVYLQEKFPQYKFCLIIGADNLQTFNKWKNYKEVLKMTELYVYPRPNCNDVNVDFIFHRIEAPMVEISSTLIRNMIKAKKDIRFFVPESVYNYIDLMNFYK